MAQPKPFKINVPDSDLEVLKQKLDLTRLPNQPEGYDVKQGVPLPEMERLVEHWKSNYLPNWREHEAKLNELPMFTLPVQSDGFGILDIHFIHTRSKSENAIPLLFVHGWPGSFIEVTKMLDGLANPKDGEQAFHVVAPSLPNYGFSQGVGKRGFNLRHYAYVCNQLMLDLGYKRYVAQGGDWGSMITRIIGQHHSENVRGVHVNLVAFDPLNVLKQPLLFLQALLPNFWPERAGLSLMNSMKDYTVDGNGYFKIQSTRPQTVAYALSDSPVALLGWVHEKLLHWTDSYPWTEDEVLTWISIYWFSRAGPGASVQTYFEAVHPSPEWNGKAADARMWDWTNAPLGISQFPKDIVGIPSILTRTLGRIVFEKFHDRGGHFAAWETPDLLVADVREMYGQKGDWHNA